MPMDERREQLVESLEQSLVRMVLLHEQLLDLLGRKREALRHGQERLVVELGMLENEKLREITQLEKRRAELVGRLTLEVLPGAAEPMRLGELAERMAEPERGRLLVLRQQLLQRMQQVREASGTIRRATEMLMKHVQGLVQTIGMQATGVCTYGGDGSPSQRTTTLRTINMTA